MTYECTKCKSVHSGPGVCLRGDCRGHIKYTPGPAVTLDLCNEVRPKRTRETDSILGEDAMADYIGRTAFARGWGPIVKNPMCVVGLAEATHVSIVDEAHSDSPECRVMGDKMREVMKDPTHIATIVHMMPKMAFANHQWFRTTTDGVTKPVSEAEVNAAIAAGRKAARQRHVLTELGHFPLIQFLSGFALDAVGQRYDVKRKWPYNSPHPEPDLDYRERVIDAIVDHYEASKK